MRYYHIILGVAGLILAGCANPAASKLKSDLGQCRSEYAAAVGSYHQLFQCFYDAKVASGIMSEGQMAIAANDLVLADKVDAHQISKDEARAAAISYAHQINSEDAALQSEQAQASAARVSAAAAIMNAFRPPPSPVYVQPTLTTPLTTQCVQNGNMTNCQSY